MFFNQRIQESIGSSLEQLNDPLEENLDYIAYDLSSQIHGAVSAFALGRVNKALTEQCFKEKGFLWESICQDRIFNHIQDDLDYIEKISTSIRKTFPHITDSQEIEELLIDSKDALQHIISLKNGGTDLVSLVDVRKSKTLSTIVNNRFDESQKRSYEVSSGICSPYGFNLFTEFLRTGNLPDTFLKLPIEDLEEPILELVELADYFDTPELFELCDKLLLSKLAPSGNLDNEIVDRILLLCSSFSDIFIKGNMPRLLDFIADHMLVEEIDPENNNGKVLSTRILEFFSSEEVFHGMKSFDISRLQKFMISPKQVTNETLERISKICPQLEDISLSCTLVTDLNCLSKHTQLKSLCIDCTKVADIGCLINCRQISEFRMTGTKVTNIDVIAYFTKLNKLHMSRNDIQNADALSNCPELNWLSICGTKISSIAFLRNCPKLETFSMDRTPITNIDALRSCPELRDLHMTETKVRRIDALRFCPELEWLHAYDTLIENIDALENCPKLLAVYLSNTLVKNVDALRKSEELSVLFLVDTPVSDTKALDHLTVNIVFSIPEEKPLTGGGPLLGG